MPTKIDKEMTTALVTLCDENYFGKALHTIREVRGIGQWAGDFVLITVGFTPPQDICDKYRLTCVQFPGIPIESLLNHYRANPLSIPTCDGREFSKVTQWEKLHVFDTYFRSWERIVFMDAGLRIVDAVDAFLSLDWKGKFLAPDDTWNDPSKRFRSQVEMTNTPHILENLTTTYGTGILDEPYFLNCIWVYDTSLLTDTTKQDLIDIMNTYPLWRTNEMGVMNIFFHFHLRAWTPFPATAKNGKYLFDWCELNRPSTQWYQYHALKYCATMPQRKRIGVAIPCYNKHIPNLLECLASIDAQTRKPDLVSISCSSTSADEFPILPQYSFGVVVSTCDERKNAAQNRNVAARRLDTDIISFIDADDQMHPQRIQALERAFSEPCDMALHSFFLPEESHLAYPPIESFNVIRNQLQPTPSGCIVLDHVAHIHHAHVTVRREIFEQSPYSEEKDHEVKEDCVFCHRLFNIPGLQTAYLNYPLTKYTPTFSMAAFKTGTE